MCKLETMFAWTLERLPAVTPGGGAEGVAIGCILSLKKHHSEHLNDVKAVPFSPELRLQRWSREGNRHLNGRANTAGVPREGALCICDAEAELSL